MYKLFTLALFALVLSACGSPPPQLSDSCRTFNPFAADCTGEDATEVQRLTCLFNPGFHSTCRGNTGVIADYCTDTNNPANAFNDSCAVELTADSLTATHRAACLINPEASDTCVELLADFCTDPDDPFHAGCRTTVGIGLKQADACMANPFAHPTCTNLLTTLCDGTGDYANIYHSLCNDVETIGYSRAFNCSIDRVPLAICQPAYMSYCSSVHVDTEEGPQFSFLNSFDEICDNLENLESVRFDVCTRGLTETRVTPFECISFLDDYCARAANELLLFGATCENGLPINKGTRLRGVACVADRNIDTIGENDCLQYIMDYCGLNLFDKTLDSVCGTAQSRDTARGMDVDACVNSPRAPDCDRIFNFCQDNANASDASCMGKTISPIVYEGQSSFQSIPLLHSEPGNENRFLYGASDEEGGLRTGNNDATPQDVVNVRIGDTSQGVGFFTGTGSDGVAYYYAGILPQTSLGEYLTSASEGTWNGKFRAVVGGVLMSAEVNMTLSVTFSTRKINAFVPHGNNHFLLEGDFNQNGVIEGTVNYGAFTGDVSTTPASGRTPNGTLIGLIGQEGAVGAFISTATGSAGYAGGFVVQMSSE